MSTSGFTTNLAALRVERRLRDSSISLQTTFERLSSGLRITGAADDAAGLAVAGILNIDGRVYAQGVRNLNDAIGVLNVQEAALRELSALSTRQRELAVQASNGVLSDAQRSALAQESERLVEEYDRIVQTTNYNGISLLNRSGGVQIQAGYGSMEIAIGLQGAAGSTASISGTPGDGTFGGHISYGTALPAERLTSGDVTGDGRDDLIVSTESYDYYDGTYSTLNTFIGRADGQFETPVPSAIMYGDRDNLTARDFNNDGKLDMLALLSGSAILSLGVGGGVFQAASASVTGGGVALDVAAADLNNDGNLDIIMSSLNDVQMFLGNGNGTFSAGATVVSGTVFGILATDLNQDGNMDVVSPLNGSGRVLVQMGNGDATFKGAATYGCYGSFDIHQADFNGDGAADLLVQTGIVPIMASLLLGNGDGTFGSSVTVFGPVVQSTSFEVADFNGDGKADFIAAIDSTVQTFIGNGDGTFKPRVSYAAAYPVQDVVLGDFNDDGAWDFAAASTNGDYTPGSVDIYYGNRESSSSGLVQISASINADLRTASSAAAAMAVIDSKITSIQKALGSVGASQSRLYTSTANLLQARENFASAESRIIDVDVANDTAAFMRSSIIQQAGAAVLAQANQAPALLLSLVK